MTEQHPAADNMRCLQQGIDLVRDLDDRHYAGVAGSPHAGVGEQFRHCIDFYECFQRGLAAGRIDYVTRDRDRRVEIDRSHAVGRIERAIAALSALDPGSVDAVLQVRLEPPLAGPASGSWCGSTVRRELQFLLSHTIHHYALIVALLELQGRKLGDQFDGFGVAPSTLSYLSRSAS